MKAREGLHIDPKVLRGTIGSQAVDHHLVHWCMADTDESALKFDGVKPKGHSAVFLTFRRHVGTASGDRLSVKGDEH